MSQQGQLHNVGTGAATIETLTGNSGGAVGPDASFNINILGNNTSGINVVGMPGTNTLTIVGIQATTTQRGTVELATDAEAIAGTDSVNALTSSNLTAKLGAQTLNGLPIGAGNTSALSWTAAPTDGQLLIGDTGSTPVLGNLTSTGGTIAISNGPGTINLETVGASGIETIGGDSGSITGASVTIFAANASVTCGSTVKFVNSGTTSTLHITDAGLNILMGSGSGNLTLTGVANIGFGNGVLNVATTASNNSGFGRFVLNAATTAVGNTAIGNYALVGLTTGLRNVALGQDAGSNYTTENDNICIYHDGTAADANTIRIGRQGGGATQQNKCFVAGIVGVTPSNQTAVLIDSSTGQLGNTTGASAGTILRSNGTNFVATTATYPTTTTSQQILYSTAANVVGQLTTANSAIAATNSSGTLAMRAFSVVTQVFTSNGTYTPTSGMLYCDIECIGGGGAGGGAPATGAATTSCGGGGGGGEYARGAFSAATIGASKSVTIGAAGTANSGATGGNGGTTSVGSTLISAVGGSGGISSSAAGDSNANGGAGGTGGTGGDFRTPGQNGLFANAHGTPPILIAGAGGNTQYGAGGAVSVTGVSNQGSAGLGYGAGGGGSSLYTSQSALSGGAGTAGIVIVTEYVIA